jgi:hypothetical protein
LNRILNDDVNGISPQSRIQIPFSLKTPVAQALPSFGKNWETMARYGLLTIFARCRVRSWRLA